MSNPEAVNSEVWLADERAQRNLPDQAFPEKGEYAPEDRPKAITNLSELYWEVE